MSYRKGLPLRLFPIALDDFNGILRYTGETWGHDQLVAYRDKLDSTLPLAQVLLGIVASQVQEGIFC